MADTLQEYLIKLGFKIDENGWKGFQSKVSQSGSNIAELGAISVATAISIGVAVEKVARHYEDLYYVSQRSGSSVSSLMAQQFGFKQIGLSADQARSAVEGFASSVRMNPGIRAMFQGMGIDTTDANKAIGQLVDRTKERFGEGGYFVAARIAAMGGMDEATFKQMWDNRERLKKEEEEHIARQKRMGIDTDDAAQKFTEYGRRLNTVGDNFGLLKDRIAVDFLPAANTTLDWVESAVTKFGDLNVSTGGWAGQLTAVALAAGGVKAALVPIMAMLRVLGIIAPAGAASLGLLRLAMLRLGPLGAFLAVMYPTAANGNEGSASGGGPVAGDSSPEAQAWRAKHGGGSGMGGGGAAGTKAAMMEFYKSKGWTPEQAAGIVANLDAESGLKPNNVGDGGKAYGLAQWHPDRQQNFAKWAGHDIRESTLQEQMEFVHYELTQGAERMAGRALQNARTARQAGGIVSQAYERPRDVFGQAAARGANADTILASQGGGGNLTVSPTTKIDIHGVSDPKKAASLAMDAQGRVNGDLTRNTASMFH